MILLYKTHEISLGHFRLMMKLENLYHQFFFKIDHQYVKYVFHFFLDEKVILRKYSGHAPNQERLSSG